MIVRFNRSPNNSYRARVTNMTLILEREAESLIDPDNTILEVMLTRALYSRDANGNLDYTKGPYAYLVKPVTDKHVELEHDGFECAGSMCMTTARAWFGGKQITLTPGRMMNAGMYVADNVNTKFCKHPTAPKVPGTVYVNFDDLYAGNGIIRSEGLPSVTATDAYIRQHNPHVATWLGQMNVWEAEQARKIEQDRKIEQRRTERQGE